MSALTLILRRARADLALVVTIFALVATTTIIIAGTVGYSRAAATVAARQALTQADAATDVAVRARTREADDAATQNTQARQLINDAFAPATVQVIRSMSTEPQRVDGRDERLHVISDSDLSGALVVADDSANASKGGEPVVVPGALTGALVTTNDGVAPEAGQTPIQGSLHTGAAGQWDLSVGDILDVGGTWVEITALIRPLDPNAPAWAGDPVAATGFTDDLLGPLIVAPDDLAQLTDVPFVNWVITPDPDELTPEDLGPLATAAGTLRSTLDTDGVARRGMSIEGDLAPTAEQANRNLQTANALNVVPLVLLLVVSVIAIGQLARILATTRGAQFALLLARGASRRHVAGWSAVEAVAITVAGSALGIGATLAILLATPAGTAQSGTVVLAGILTALTVLLALLVVTTAQVRRVANLRVVGDGRSGRARHAAALASVVVLVGAAALSWAQWRRYGSPLVTRDDGSLGTDLVAGAAPALLLTAAAFIALALLAPAARLVERATHRGAGLPRHLGAAHVSRGLMTYAVPVVLTVLAVGATTVSGMYAATSADLRDNLRALSQGADVRATVNTTPTGPLPGLGNAPVWTRDITIGDSSAMLMTSSISQMADVAIVPKGAGDPHVLAASLDSKREPSRGVPIAAGTSEFTIEMNLVLQVSEQTLTDLTYELDNFYDIATDEGAVDESVIETEDSPRERAFAGRSQDLQTVTGDDVIVAVIATLRDSSTGVIHTVRAGELVIRPDLAIDDSDTLISTRAEASETFQVDLSQTRGQASAYEVIGLDLSLGNPLTEFDLEAQTAIVVAGERQPQDGAATAWTAPTEQNLVAGQPEGPTTQVSPDPTGGLIIARTGVLHAFTLTSEIRLTTVNTEAAPVPLAITAPVAEANNLSVGSPIEVRVFGATIDAEVAAVVNAIPGTLQPNVALADTAAMGSALLAQGQLLGDPSEVWISTDDPGRVADETAAVRGIASASTAPPVAITDANSAVRLVFWAASAGSILLAVVGIGAVAATVLAARRPEVAVLRALGMPSGSQVRARAVEVGSVVAVSAAFGLASGWLVGVLVVPDLAASTTASGLAVLPAAVALELLGWLGVLAVGALAVAVTIAAVVAKVRAQALDRTYREEIR